MANVNKDNLEVYKSACRMCHGGCGVLVYVKEGKVVKITGDPESPLNKGKTCIKAQASIEHLYNPNRLKYPLKRIGKRGEGKWKRISWDEAFDEIIHNIIRIKKNDGIEAIAVGQGTGRHHFYHVIRFANALGTPNWLEPGTAQCFLPRLLTGALTFGSLPICDYYGDVQPRCLLVWGHNPVISGPDGEIQFRVKECLTHQPQLIVVDPRKTEMAEKASLWLQVRPGTDDALALSMLHVIINENLYDKDFVETWTKGFEALAQRVQQFSPTWAESITRVPARKIREAAQRFAETKPACLEWGVALEHTPNSLQTLRALALLPAITGNIDIPGGWILGMKVMPEVDILTRNLPMDMRIKRLGADRFKVLSGPASLWPSAHIPSVFKAIRTGQPYPVKALLNFGNNGLISYANSKQVYETFMVLDFMMAMDLYMTPTAELADIVLPAATWLEMDSVFSMPSAASHVILCQQKITRMWECRPDEEVLVELARRLNLPVGTESVEEIIQQQLIGAGKRYQELDGLTFRDLKEKGAVSVPVQYRKFQNTGFNTASGKIELSSSYLELCGYDPLPYYQEPPESPISTPELAEKYPLILTTGGRSRYFFHSEYRQIPGLRKKEPNPLVEIHPETAKKYNIHNGDWVWIETARGKIKQKATVTGKIAAGVVNVQHGWWFPEEAPPQYGMWKSNANVLTSNYPPYDPAVGTYQLRALLCKIYPVTHEDQEIENNNNGLSSPKQMQMDPITIEFDI